MGMDMDGYSPFFLASGWNISTFSYFSGVGFRSMFMSND
jgi:hypothetical protein